MATTLGGTGNQQGYATPETIHEGQILMDALKAFIIPIVKTCLSEKDQHVTSTPSNKDDPVLSALKTFVAKLVKGEIEQQDSSGAIPARRDSLAEEKDLVTEGDMDTPQGYSWTDQEELVIPVPPSENEWRAAYNNVSDQLGIEVSYVKAYAGKMMQHWRHTIFNRWPIRMLWFGRNGSTKLIERSDAYNILVAILCRNLRIVQMHQDDLRKDIVKCSIYRVADDYRYGRENLQYAILSHTWLQDSPGEITYKSWVEGTYDRNSAGYKKLENFGRVSADHGLQFGWMDTLCINKDSSSELDESIRSMYQWYEKSAVCITYLAETSRIDDMHRDRWFRRGWTLQELIAPHVLFFYNRDWKRFTNGENDRKDYYIVTQIQKGADITPDELASFHKKTPYISRRMKWAAGREVTREEDAAYSLMGLFGVSMSTAYGEGARHAFARLIKKIIANPRDGTVAMDIVNCTTDPGGNATLNSTILPYGPGAFNASAPPHELWQDFEPHIPMMITQRGLSVSVLLIRGIDYPMEYVIQGRTWGQVKQEYYLDKHPPVVFDLLREPFEPDNGPYKGTLFAVLNHTIKNNHILLPLTCLAVMGQRWFTYWRDANVLIQIPSDGSTFHRGGNRPLTFSPTDSTYPGALEPIPIPIADLEANGLYLRTLYM